MREVNWVDVVVRLSGSVNRSLDCVAVVVDDDAIFMVSKCSLVEMLSCDNCRL